MNERVRHRRVYREDIWYVWSAIYYALTLPVCGLTHQRWHRLREIGPNGIHLVCKWCGRRWTVTEP